MGGNIIFCLTQLNFFPGYIKNVDTHHEISSLKKQVIKKVIAKKPLTNLYEMNSRSKVIQTVQEGISLDALCKQLSETQYCLLSLNTFLTELPVHIDYTFKYN